MELLFCVREKIIQNAHAMLPRSPALEIVGLPIGRTTERMRLGKRCGVGVKVSRAMNAQQEVVK